MEEEGREEGEEDSDYDEMAYLNPEHVRADTQAQLHRFALFPTQDLNTGEADFSPSVRVSSLLRETTYTRMKLGSNSGRQKVRLRQRSSRTTIHVRSVLLPRSRAKGIRFPPSRLSLCISLRHMGMRNATNTSDRHHHHGTTDRGRGTRYNRTVKSLLCSCRVRAIIDC